MSEPFHPKPHQMRALQIMMKQASLGLLMDPGLGKTSTWLAAFTTLKELGFVNNMLVIAPLLPMYDTWPKEIEKFDEFKDLTWCFLHGKDKEWHLRNTDADIYLVNPEGIQWLVSACQPARIFDVLCVDESTRFKNSGSKRFRAMRPHFPGFLYRWIGTGTVAPKGLTDLFAQVFILDGGEALGKYVTHFRNKWFYTEPWDQYTYLPLPNAFTEITEAISPLVVVMEAEDYLKMPDVLVVDKLIELPPKVQKFYKELEEDFIATFPDTERALTAPTAAAAGAKCRQVANGAVYVDTKTVKLSPKLERDGYEELHSLKLDMLDDLLEEIGEHPVLVVYEFRHDKQRINQRHLDWPDITGQTGECLQHTITQFNEGKITRLLIQSSKAHGLNIQSACHHMIWFGMTWNWEDYKQMVDRLYRQGQKATMVLVYRILADGTLDVDMAQRLEHKRQTEQGIKDATSRKREERDLG